MTPMQIFELAAAHLSQTPQDSADLLELTPSWLNLLFAEALPYENSIRKNSGKPPLSAPPIVTAKTIGTPLDFSESICQVAIVYGLVACFYNDDDNDFRQADFRARYISALNEAEIACCDNVIDVYSEGENEYA